MPIRSLNVSDRSLVLMVAASAVLVVVESAWRSDDEPLCFLRNLFAKLRSPFLGCFLLFALRSIVLALRGKTESGKAGTCVDPTEYSPDMVDMVSGAVLARDCVKSELRLPRLSDELERRLKPNEEASMPAGSSLVLFAPAIAGGSPAALIAIGRLLI